MLHLFVREIGTRRETFLSTYDRIDHYSRAGLFVLVLGAFRRVE